MPTTINRNKDLVVKSTDLGTVSILCIISIAKWDTKQVHACKMHGTQLRWHVHMSSEKSVECEWCWLDLVCSNLIAPMFLNGPTLQSLCDKYRKQEYHWVSLGIPSTFQKEIRWHISIGFGTDVLALKTKSIHLHLLETCYTGLQSISTYCCTYQSMNHNKSKSRIYFWTFITVKKICTDCGAFSTLYCKAISLSQVTSLCHTIEWYYLRNKVFWCGFGWSWEYILRWSVW